MCPRYIRDAFHKCIYLKSLKGPHKSLRDDPWYAALADKDSISFRSSQMQRRWDKMDLAARGKWLVGQLWNCTDILPNSYCQVLHLPQGSTYAKAGRRLGSIRIEKSA